MIKYLKISLKSKEKLPFKFIGLTIRGVFGVGLKNVVCINPSKECKECFAKNNCLYYDFYEVDNPKWRLGLNLNSNVEFDLFLFEEASLKISYVLTGLYFGFAKIGIKNKPIDFQLFVNDELIFDRKKFLNVDIKEKEFRVDEIRNNCIIEFITPFRIKENILLKDVNLDAILENIYDRLNGLKNQPIQELHKPTYKIKSQQFKFVDFTKASHKQKLGGLIGKIELDEIDNKSYYFLKLAEIIGVGKGTTFGLGNIKVN